MYQYDARHYVDDSYRTYYLPWHGDDLSPLATVNLNTLEQLRYEYNEPGTDGRWHMYYVPTNDYKYVRIDGEIYAVVYGELVCLDIWDADLLEDEEQPVGSAPPSPYWIYYCDVYDLNVSYNINNLPQPYKVWHNDPDDKYGTYEFEKYFQWNNTLYAKTDNNVYPVTLVSSPEAFYKYYCSLKENAEHPYTLDDLDAPPWLSTPDTDYLIGVSENFGGYFLSNGELYAIMDGDTVPVTVSGYSGPILETKPEPGPDPIEDHYWDNFEVRDIDWLSSMQQTFEFYEVDPGTWGDKRQLTNILSCSLTRDRDNETLGHASISTTEEIGECYVRIYLVAFQNRTERKFPLGVYLCQTPSIKFNGHHKDISIDAYTPLIELKEKLPPLGYSIITGRNVMDVAAILTRNNVRAPIARATDDATIPFDFCADTGDTWLTFLTDFIASAGYEFDLDEMGRIMFVPKQNLNSMQPVWFYNDDNSSILYPDVTLSRDLYGVPNTVEVTYSHDNDTLYAKVVNNDPDSPVSKVNRGREIVYRSDNPEMVGVPNQEQLNEYALNLLRDLSTIEYTVTYSHGYCPVRVGDCVRLNYSRAGLEDINAKVIRQSIKCEPGCPVEETAVYNVSLFSNGTVVETTYASTNTIEWERGSLNTITGNEVSDSMIRVRSGFIDYGRGTRIKVGSNFTCSCFMFSHDSSIYYGYKNLTSGKENLLDDIHSGDKIRLVVGYNSSSTSINPTDDIDVRVLVGIPPVTPVQDSYTMADELALCDFLTDEPLLDG